MLRNIKLIGEERSYPSKLHDALPSVHDCNLILAHKLYATLSSDDKYSDTNFDRPSFRKPNIKFEKQNNI